MAGRLPKCPKANCRNNARDTVLFFNKRPSRIETINDLNSDVVNLFRCIRDYPDELARLIAYTPYARTEYYARMTRSV